MVTKTGSAGEEFLPFVQESLSSISRVWGGGDDHGWLLRSRLGGPDWISSCVQKVTIELNNQTKPVTLKIPWIILIYLSWTFSNKLMYF